MQTWIDKVCGTCVFAIPFKPPSGPIVNPVKQPDLFECRKNPPLVIATPVQQDMGGGRVGMGMQLRSDYVKVRDDLSACSYHEEKEKDQSDDSDISNYHMKPPGGDKKFDPQTFILPKTNQQGRNKTQSLDPIDTDNIEKIMKGPAAEPDSKN